MEQAAAKAEDLISAPKIAFSVKALTMNRRITDFQSAGEPRFDVSYKFRHDSQVLVQVDCLALNPGKEVPHHSFKKVSVLFGELRLSDGVAHEIHVAVDR